MKVEEQYLCWEIGGNVYNGCRVSIGFGKVVCDECLQGLFSRNHILLEHLACISLWERPNGV